MTLMMPVAVTDAEERAAWAAGDAARDLKTREARRRHRRTRQLARQTGSAAAAGLGFAVDCKFDCLTWEDHAAHALGGQAEDVDESRHEMRVPRAAKRGGRRTRRAPVARKRTRARRGVVEGLTFTPEEDAYWRQLEALGVPRPRRDESGAAHFPCWLDGEWTLQAIGDDGPSVLPARFKTWDEYFDAGLFHEPVMLPHRVVGQEAHQ